MTGALLSVYGVFAAALSFALVTVVLPWLRRRVMLDLPGERTNHKVPTPRGGGIGVVAALIVMMVVAQLLGHEPAGRPFISPLMLVSATFALAALSLIDDMRTLSPLVRLAGQVIVVFLCVAQIPADARVFDELLPVAVERVLLAFGWLWFINLYNFMDGIDGITGVETVAIASGILLVRLACGLSLPLSAVLLIGVALGFLVHNWHPARVFLGDVGSVPLGFLVGALLIALAIDGQLSAALILPAYYIFDSGLTLIERAYRREKIWQAHSQHAYQRAVRRGAEHDRVVAAIAFVNALLVVLAVFSIGTPIAAILVAYVLVACFVWTLRTGYIDNALVRRGR